MPDGSIVVHNVDTQTVVQEIPPNSFPSPPTALVDCLSGFSVPSSQRAQKLQAKPIKLLRSRKDPSAGEVAMEEVSEQISAVEDDVQPEPLEL